MLALLWKRHWEAHQEEQVSPELRSSWGTDNFVSAEKSSSPQMAIYKPLQLVGPAHMASNWMFSNLCEEQLQRFKYFTAKGVRVEIFSLFSSKVRHECPTERGSLQTIAKDLLVLSVGWKALGVMFYIWTGSLLPTLTSHSHGTPCLYPYINSCYSLLQLHKWHVRNEHMPY